MTCAAKLLLNAGFRPVGDFLACQHIHRICVYVVGDSKHSQRNLRARQPNSVIGINTPPDSAGSPIKSPEVCRLVT